MNIFNQPAKCNTCGQTVGKNASFCPTCGAALETRTEPCPACRQPIPAAAKFCPYCGEAAAPPLAQNRWGKGADEFAVRIEGEDLEGLLRRDLIVEPGTRAILLIDGQYQGTLPPGKYSLDNIREKLRTLLTLGDKRTFTAILIDNEPVELQFEVTNQFTADPLRIGFVCHLVFQLDPAGQAPFRFITTLLKGRRAVTLAQIRTYLFPEIQQAAQEWLWRQRVAALNDNPTLTASLEQHLEMQLANTFERSGLTFLNLRAVDFAHERFDEIQQVREKYFLAGEQQRAELEGRKYLFEVFDANELQDIFEETRQVEHYERRAAVWARMRQAVLSDRMDEIRSEEQFEIFLREQDTQRLIRDHEYEQLKRTFREEMEDHELRRRFLLRRLEMEQQIELDRLALQGETELLELRLKKRQLELEAQLERERMVALERKQTEIETRQKELALARQEAQTRAEIEMIEREQETLDVELAMYAKELLDERKHQRQRQAMLLEAEREERALARRLREQAETQRLELERLETLSLMPAEALITASDAEQAQLLAELKQTELMKDMTDKQIMALAAQKSPELAQAIVQTEMYERLLTEQKAAHDERVETMREAARMQQETAFRAMDTQRDVAQSFAEGQRPTVIAAGMGGGMMMGGYMPGYYGGGSGAGEAGRVIICPQCRVDNKVGVRFCENCGYQFFTKAEQE